MFLPFLVAAPLRGRAFLMFFHSVTFSSWVFFLLLLLLLLMLCLRDVGVGWGGVKFLHIERKITSVVHSHPPSYVNTCLVDDL